MVRNSASAFFEYFESAERLLNDLNIDIQTLGTKIMKEKPKLKKVKMNKKLYILKMI